MTRDEFERITPETFDRLPDHVKREAIEFNREEVLDWRVSCPKCKHVMKGKLSALRGKPCEKCGHGNAG